MKIARFQRKVRAVLPPSKNIYVSKQTIKGVASIPVIEARFLHMVSESMGFDYELMVPEDGLFWHMNWITGTWTRNLRTHQMKQADMAFATYP
ncbi:glutamate receptor ionotropic, kainate 1 [Nephila pilipes]|uniref:Glutamate receptor ionotropic, kainate 1 n=1 Tax=Nephila pilipes TaxID=299642 RepID=A0A8X6TK66_NEPPI|nr:glutamate receptor ionotropic, kainate 1 [Nephila pilipes]